MIFTAGDTLRPVQPVTAGRLDKDGVYLIGIGRIGYRIMADRRCIGIHQRYSRL